ncbi:TR10B factor, partial [Alectura lathami]|nr:TR10B factor [Alectura lathami]
LGSAAAVRERRDKVDLLEPGEDFYQVQDGGWYCKKCPAEPCKVPNGSSTCLPCKEDKYIEYPSGFTECLGCRTCREDQVQLSPCNATRDTQCVCRNGTFCSPDHPCEMCQKCRPRCPKGQVEIAPCTPHSDLQCGPPTDTSSSNQGIIWAIVLPCVFLLVSLVLLWRCCCSQRAAGDSGHLSRKSGNVLGYLVQQLTKCRWGGLGTRDNNINAQRDQDQQLLSAVPGSQVPSAPGLEEMAPRTSNPNVKTWTNLVPVAGEDPIIVLQRSFDTFIRDIPPKYWRGYVRRLGLTENDIDLAEMQNRYMQEASFQMLVTWMQKLGSSASVNTLLETLRSMDLGGVAESISSKLVQLEFFQYEVS